MPPLYRTASWPLKPTRSDDFAVRGNLYGISIFEPNSIYIERQKHFCTKLVHELS
jgi:hypothetical protein